MQKAVNPKSFLLEDDCGVISLLFQYMSNELPPTLNKRVAQVLGQCRECQVLYEDMKDFFDESENLLYEIMHSDEVANSRRQLDELISNNPTIPPKPNLNPISSNVLEGECFCCGA